MPYITLIIAILLLMLPGYIYAGQYFQCNDMDHFSPEGVCTNARLKKPPEAKQGNTEDNSGFTREQIEMWAEPSVDSSGRVVSKLPPLPAMRFLADPNPENAKAYMEWNQKRMESIEKSQSLLQSMSGNGAAQSHRIDNLKEIKGVDFFFSPT